MNGFLEHRPLEGHHIRALLGLDYTFPFRGYAFFDCGKLVGMGGVALYEGKWIAFSDIAPDATLPKIAIWRAAQRVVKEIIMPMKKPVYAGVAEPSTKWATLLGFGRMQGEVFVWGRV